MTIAGAPRLLLQRAGRQRLIDDLRQGDALAGHWIALTAVIIIFGGIYGGTLGLWRSNLLALYVAVKLPLVLLVTSLLTALLNWISASLFGAPLKFAQVMVLTFMALAISAVVLASVAPIAWFVTTSLPPPTTGARTVHNILFLMHTGLVAAAGFTGTRFLWHALRETCGNERGRNVYAVWLVAFALVGGEVSWLLRPFVGSVYKPVVFIRSDSFDRNIYEFIISDILPHLFSAGATQ